MFQDISALIEAGKGKLASFGGGGGGGGGGGDDAPKAEEKVEEEEEEEVDMGGGMDMFGGGDEGECLHVVAERSRDGRDWVECFFLVDSPATWTVGGLVSLYVGWGSSGGGGGVLICCLP